MATTTTTVDLFHRELRQTMQKLGWIYPFFLIPSARAKLVPDMTNQITQTAAVTPRGVIYVSAAFWATIKPSVRQFVLAHELCHPLFGHEQRRQGRDSDLWNQAGDYAINQILTDAGLDVWDQALLPGRAGAPAEWRAWPAERIYDALLQEQQEQAGKGGGEPQAGSDGDDDADGDKQPMPGAGCGMIDDDVADRDPSDTRTDSEVEHEWREAVVQAAAMEKQCGQGKGGALAKLAEIPPAKVDWASVLRGGTASALACHGRDEQTWSRRGRRSGPVGPQFPGWHGHRANLVAVVDSSGSMSDKALSLCAAECSAAARESGVAIYLIVHDHGVTWEGWVNPKGAPQLAAHAVGHGRGGTDAAEAYRCAQTPRSCQCAPTARCKCVRRPAKFDVFVHLTDCCLRWPSWPTNVRKRLVARVGAIGMDVPAGAQVVDIELPDETYR